jgi:hypothetical protein
MQPAAAHTGTKNHVQNINSIWKRIPYTARLELPSAITERGNTLRSPQRPKTRSAALVHKRELAETLAFSHLINGDQEAVSDEAIDYG